MKSLSTLSKQSNWQNPFVDIFKTNNVFESLKNRTGSVTDFQVNFKKKI